MTATDIGAVHEVLDEDECRRLLGTATVGRLAFTDGALPVIVPLGYLLHDDAVVTVADRRQRLSRALRGAVVAFGVDAWDGATHTGWSVNVIGPTRIVRDRHEADLLDDLWSGGPPVPSRCYVAVGFHLVHGWRTAAAAAAIEDLSRGPGL